MRGLRVRFIYDSHYKDWNSGDNVPCAVVVVKDRIVTAPLETIRVMNETI